MCFQCSLFKIFGEDVHPFWSFWYFQLGGWAKVDDDVVFMLILKTNKKRNRPDLWGDPPDWIACSPNKVCNFVRISFGLKYVQLACYPLIFQIHQIPSGQFITTFPAAWSPQMVVKSKGIHPKYGRKNQVKELLHKLPRYLVKRCDFRPPQTHTSWGERRPLEFWWFPSTHDHPRAWL